MAILLVFFLALTLVGCDNSSGNSSDSEIITLPDTESQVQVSEGKSSKNVYTYKTAKVEEYLEFLESFDEASNEILGITTSMPSTIHGSGNFYMVTYRELK